MAVREQQPLARLAGWPCALRQERVGGQPLSLYTVAQLESQLDRERLLTDDAYEPPYWALIWSGSRLLADWLVARSAGLAPKPEVLDVGCGLGLVALSMARAGARVLAIDRDPDAIAFVRASSGRAGLEVESRAIDLAALPAGRRWDAVVAAELLYDRPGFAELARELTKRVAPGGALYVADGFRVDTASFYEALDALGFCCVSQEHHSVREEGTPIRIRLSAYARRRGRGLYSATARYST